MLAWQMFLSATHRPPKRDQFRLDIWQEKEIKALKEPEIRWRKPSVPGSGGKVSRGWFLSVPTSGGGRAAVRWVLCCWGSSCTETCRPKLETFEEPAARANPAVMGRGEGNGWAQGFCVFGGMEPRWSISLLLQVPG